MATLPGAFKKLIDDKIEVVVGTVNRDGSPQLSVMWATYDGDDILLSTIEGRAKWRNWQRDPRTSALIFDKDAGYGYVEIRGTVRMTHDGGPELINRLSEHYYGRPWTGDDGTDHVRVVVRLTPEHVVEVD